MALSRALILLLVGLLLVSLFFQESDAWRRRRRRRRRRLPIVYPKVCRRPCFNGGRCYFGAHNRQYCRCSNSYFGAYCQFRRCTLKCYNGGRCATTGFGRWLRQYCSCPYTHYGTNCQYRRCTLNCQNTGRCVIRHGQPTCVCPRTHTGYLCHIRTACSLRCYNGGQCRRHHWGLYCQCRPGYYGRYCQTRICFRTCYNGGKCYHTGGGTACRCPSTYFGSACQFQRKSLLLSTKTKLYSIDLPPRRGNRLLASGLSNAVAVDFHHASKTYFWTDVARDTIRRVGFDGRGQRVIHKTGLSVPDGLAVDWMAGNLYWTDTGTDTIEVSRLNGRHRKVLMRGLDQPRAIALHPRLGYMFFSDWGRIPRIERAHLDGSSRRYLYYDPSKRSLKWPNGLTIDFARNMLYWADAGVDQIGRMNFNGGSRRIIFSKGIKHPFDISIDGRNLYWTDWNSNKVERGTIDGSRHSAWVTVRGGRVSGVKVVDPSKQRGSNVCTRNNGGCTHLCLAYPIFGNFLGRRCVCPDKYAYGCIRRG